MQVQHPYDPRLDELIAALEKALTYFCSVSINERGEINIQGVSKGKAGALLPPRKERFNHPYIATLLEKVRSRKFWANRRTIVDDPCCDWVQITIEEWQDWL